MLSSYIMEMFPSLNTSISLFSFVILMIFIRFKWVSFYSKTKKRLPPSPRKLPVLGNLHQLGSSTHRTLQAWSQKHGPLFTIHLGNVHVLIASSSEVVQEIIKTHDLTFSNRPKLTIPDILLYGSSDITFSPYGEHWRRLKSIAIVKLLSNTRVQSFRQAREEEIALTIHMIEESCGSLVNMSGFLMSLSNDIVCKVALGRAYHDPKFTNLLAGFIDVLGVFSIGDYIPWLSWVERLSGLKGKAEKVAKEFDEFVESVVEEHVNKRTRVDTKSDEGEDLVDILLDIQKDVTTGFILSGDAVKVTIIDMFVAGTHTTFSTLEWTISELIRHPRVMKKLQKEVTETAQGRSTLTEDDLKNMQYLNAIVKESLRLHPPLPLLIPRETTQDVKLMGYDIPARTQVMINAWCIGRDPNLWDESEEFKPERFSNCSIDNAILQFESFPFGFGRRGCPGSQFAIAIIKLALANLVYKFDLTLPNGFKYKDLDMSETNGIAVHRKSPLLVMATPR